MQRYDNRIKEKEETARIGAAKEREIPSYKSTKSKRKIYKRWYAVYMATTVTAVVLVIMLIAFGVGGNNKPLRESMFSGIADKIAGWLVDMNFPLSENKGYSDTAQEETSNNRNNVSGTDDIPTMGADDSSTSENETVKGFYDFDYSKVPNGHTPIIPMDLSLSQYGDTYINNVTGYKPDTVALVNKALGGGYEQLSASSGPMVLIIHTHGTEAYSENGAISCSSDEESYARTSDTRKNVVAVGKALADELTKNGIPTAHCTILHDSVQYKDSYARAEETIRKYMAEYPTIKLVIDIHRDSVVRSNGEIVRPVTQVDGKAAAQVMCVVGSDWEGDDCPNWENNLSLALKIRKELNGEYENLCRPPFLKGHTYNQEIAPYSLLLEIGAEGNSLEEALLAAELTGKSLAKIIGQL